MATTFCVHLIPGAEVARTFEDQIALHRNSIYLLRLWIVLFHILIVLASLWTVVVCRFEQSASWLGLGFAGYLLFGGAELLRTSMALFTLNGGWRARYESDATMRDTLRPLLEMWPDLNQALFFLLILGICLGNLFYGIGLISGFNGRRFDVFLGWALLLWFLYSLTSILHKYVSERVPSFPDWWAWTFQPAVRLGLGIWLWKQAKGKLFTGDG